MVGIAVEGALNNCQRFVLCPSMQLGTIRCLVLYPTCVMFIFGAPFSRSYAGMDTF